MRRDATRAKPKGAKTRSARARPLRKVAPGLHTGLAAVARKLAQTQRLTSRKEPAPGGAGGLRWSPYQYTVDTFLQRRTRHVA